jgi:outer membrane protein assembly factor BamD (BamD/ComL family)
MQFPPQKILVFVCLLAFAGCSSESDSALEKIRNAEVELYPDSTLMPDLEKAKEMIKMYSDYADKYPDDTLSPGFLFKAGDMSSKINETAKAIELYGKLTTTYPDNPNASYALFLQGFIYENQVGDPAKARPYYEQFLKKYPNHPLAQDVAFSLQNLGKTPEELIREFESRQQGNDSTTEAKQ